VQNVYVCLPNAKSNVQKILENDPTASVSFARQSYDFKDGKPYDVEGWILLISGDEQFIKWAEEQLGDNVTKLDKDKAIKIIDMIKKEKDKASEGFGMLFR